MTLIFFITSHYGSQYYSRASVSRSVFIRSSVKQVLDELLELIEVDLAAIHRVNLLERHLQLLLVHVRRLAQELIELVKRDPMVLVNVKLLEDLFEALLREELLLIHADHHELVEGDEAVARAVRHRDHVVDPLLVEVRPEVLSIPIDQLSSGQCSISARVQVCEDLLELHRVVHVQKVLDKVAKSRLLRRVFRRERSQVGEGPGHILAALVKGCAVVFFLQTAHHVKPGVLEGISRRDAVFFFAEDAGDKVLSLGADLVPAGAFERVLADLDLVNDLFVCLAVEGRFAREEDVQDDADAPDVALLTVGAMDDFRCHVVRCAENAVHRVLVVDAPGRSEVDQFDDRVLLILEVNVLRLDVAVHDRVLVQVVHGREELADHVCSLDLVEVQIRGHTFIQSASMHHLVDEVDLLLVLVHFNHLANIGMVQLLEELDFLEEFAPLAKLKILFSDDFDGAGDA